MICRFRDATPHGVHSPSIVNFRLHTRWGMRYDPMLMAMKRLKDITVCFQIKIKRPAHLRIVERLGGFQWIPEVVVKAELICSSSHDITGAHPQKLHGCALFVNMQFAICNENINKKIISLPSYNRQL